MSPWFVWGRFCHFRSAVFASFPDSREETVLGSIPLPSYVIAPVEPDDNISRRYAFKVTDAVASPSLLISSV